MSEKVLIEGEELTLHPSGALFWEKKSLLMLSDVHLGKISHFRKFGAAIPAQGCARKLHPFTQAGRRV